MNSVIDHQIDTRDFSVSKPKVGDFILNGDKKLEIILLNNFIWGFNIIAKDEFGEKIEFKEEQLNLF